MTYTIGYLFLFAGIGIVIGASVAVYAITAVMESDMKRAAKHSQCRTTQPKIYNENDTTFQRR